MQMQLDLEANQLTLISSDSRQSIQFSRRWECLLIDLIYRSALLPNQAAVDIKSFSVAAATRGQKTPVTRMQMSRLISSIFQGFDSIGQSQWIKRHFKFRQREKTVGPWYWQLDELALIEPNEPSASKLNRFALSKIKPRLTVESQSKQIRTALLWFLNSDALAFDGEYDQALERLEQADLSGLSDSAIYLLELRRASWLLLSGQLDEAESTLQSSLKTATKLSRPQQVWFQFHAEILLLRVRYAQNPSGNARMIESALTAKPRAALQPSDALALAAQSNLLSLVQRRRMESLYRPQERQLAKKYWYRAMDSLSTALIGNLAVQSYELVQRCSVNMAYLQQKALEMKLTTSIDEVFNWYACAFSWNNKFNLSENSCWEYIMLAEFYLLEPKVQERFQAKEGPLHWQGVRPDKSDFYISALKNARHLGAPDQIILALLNGYIFESRFGSSKSAKTYANQWTAMCREHPDHLKALILQGYELPVELRPSVD